MTIDYYVIDVPETVVHGITLRSVVAGFFYKKVTDAFETKDKFVKCLGIASKTVGLDPFNNLLSKHSSGSSGK